MVLPTYELKINPDNDSFVDAIALVDEPAIESNFIAFAKEQKGLTFNMDDQRMELLGAAMIPNMLIYRRDANGNQYNVFFSADTIRQIAQVFSKNSFQKNMNLEHTSLPAKSYVFQSYIVDTALGMNSPANLALPDGAWVVGVKVTDASVWNDIKTGKVKGFSVEGVFELIKQDFSTMPDGINGLSPTINIKSDERDFMNLVDAITNELKKINQCLVK